jgi:tetratricopeptide (TPR) repeat protein
MVYSDEEQAKLKKQNTQSAIDLALAGRWREAVTVNKSIVELFPDDTEALNRLGRAFLELGEYGEAREAYRKAKEQDPYNTIADRNLRRLELLTIAGAKPIADTDVQRVEPQVFLEETGKAGVFNLSRLAPREVLAGVVAGDKVNLRASGAVLAIEGMSGEQLGIIDPRYALRLLKLMKGGNRYSANVISSAEDKLSVIIRETYQDPSQIGQISFPTRQSPATVRKPELEVSGEELESAVEGEEADVSQEERLEDETYPDDGDDEEEDLEV